MKRIGIMLFLMVKIFVVCLFSCKKNEIPSGFKGEPRLFIDVEKNTRDTHSALFIEKDSAHYRFAYKPADVTNDTIILAVHLAGNSLEKDRVFKLVIDPSASTAKPEEYEFPNEFVMAAGKFISYVPLIVKRSERLTNTQIQLKIRLVSSTDFQINQAEYGFAGERISFRIYWSDILSRPSWWVGNHRNLGKYSRVKHRFVLDAFEVSPARFEAVYIVNDLGTVIGISDTQLATSITLNGQDLLNSRLDLYNRQSPEPLRNEFNEIISFCATCN